MAHPVATPPPSLIAPSPMPTPQRPRRRRGRLTPRVCDLEESSPRSVAIPVILGPRRCSASRSTSFRATSSGG
jgi:hypothetical protein